VQSLSPAKPGKRLAAAEKSCLTVSRIKWLQIRSILARYSHYQFGLATVKMSPVSLSLVGLATAKCLVSGEFGHN
jgi:hypothetical protein